MLGIKIGEHLMNDEFKTINISIELMSFNDIVRLAVYLSNSIHEERPHIYTYTSNKLNIYYLTLRRFLYGFKPLIITFFVKNDQRIKLPYLEYSKNPTERIIPVDASKLVDPSKTYIAIYKTISDSLVTSLFKEESESNRESVLDISEDWISKIKINKLDELTRIAFFSQNLILTKELSSDLYLYITGFPIPVLGVAISESIYSPIFYCIASTPLSKNRLARFIVYKEDESEIEFKLGADISDNEVPLIYIKNHPLGKFDIES